MEIASILIAAAIFIPTAAYVARPLISPPSSEDGRLGARGSQLHAEKERILDAIQELDFDRSMGKIPVEHYQARREELISRGVATMKALEGLASDPAQREEDPLEAEVRRAVEQLREGSRVGFCPQCGTRAEEGDLFCSSCGYEFAVAKGRD